MLPADVEKAITILTIIFSALATVLSRRKDNPKYAPAKLSDGTTGEFGFGAAISSESKRVDMLDRRVDRLEKDLREQIEEQGEAILAAITRASMENNQRFNTQNDVIQGLRRDVDKMLLSQNGNGPKHG